MFNRLLTRYAYAGQFALENLLPGLRGNSIGSNLTSIDFSGVTTLLLPTIASLAATAATVGAMSVTGVTTAKSAASVPASAGAVAAGIPIQLFSDGPAIYVTSDVPSFSAVKGSLCINTGGSSTSTRLYVNNGTTNWIAITTAS